MYIYKGSLAVHGVALGKFMVSPAIEMCHPIFLGEMDMAACYFFQHGHTVVYRLQCLFHVPGRRFMKGFPSSLLPKDVKAHLVYIAVEMGHVCNAGKVVHHIISDNTGNAGADALFRQMAKTPGRSL